MNLSDIVGESLSPKIETKRNIVVDKEEKKEVIVKLHVEKPKTPVKKFEKIIICKSRELTFNELVTLNKLFSVLIFKEEFHADKKAEDLLFQLLILDFTKKAHLSWYLRNKEYLKLNANIINLAISKKALNADAIARLKKTFSFDSVIKKIDSEFVTTAAQMLIQMLIDHQGLPCNSPCDKIYRCLQPGTKKK